MASFGIYETDSSSFVLAEVKKQFTEERFVPAPRWNDPRNLSQSTPLPHPHIQFWARAASHEDRFEKRRLPGAAVPGNNVDPLQTMQLKIAESSKVLDMNRIDHFVITFLKLLEGTSTQNLAIAPCRPTD